MTENCYEIGTIQAFLDGELDNDSLEQVARHVAACDGCAMLLAEAENESAFAFAALDGELNSLVPTERIRANLYSAIAKEKKPFWKKIFGENFSWTNPSVAAFASLILVAGIFTTLYIVRENRAPMINEIAKNEPLKDAKPQAGDILKTPVAIESVNENPVKLPAPRIEKALAKPSTANSAFVQNAAYKPEKSAVKTQSPKTEKTNADNAGASLKNQGLVGEENYVKTIATLDATVNSSKDQVLRPSARVAFEKDLAVVNDSIEKMQREVRGNPKNEAAKQLLRSAYQNKIDLLNSVVDRGEMMATLK